MTSRHRGAFAFCRYELSRSNSLLSLEYLSLLSEKLSTKVSRISKSDFRLCSIYQSHSQAGFCFSTQKLILYPTWAYFWTFSLLFRKTPSQWNDQSFIVHKKFVSGNRKLDCGLSLVISDPKIKNVPHKLQTEFLFPMKEYRKGS